MKIMKKKVKTKKKAVKKIVNKNKIVNHFYNNVQMMDLLPQVYNNSYFGNDN
jgi:hypothetical protein